MRTRILTILLTLISVYSTYSQTNNNTAQTSRREANAYKREGYRLVWSDEFSHDGRPDARKWGYERGFERNHEAQYYQRENAWCEDGRLIIEGRRERRISFEYNPTPTWWDQKDLYANYTSASINTKGRFTFTYGRLEVRAKIPVSRGAWPAIWLLGITNPWPHCGEIDVMEYYHIGGVPHILANAAWGGKRAGEAVWDDIKIPYAYFTDLDSRWAEKFHIWRMDWDQEGIRIYVDGILLNEIPSQKTVNRGGKGEGINPFSREHYILLNLALGGDNGGPIDDSALPQRYEVDYVRVYQK